MRDIFTQSVLDAPTPETIVYFLNERVRSYFTHDDLLDPHMGVDVGRKKKKAPVLSPAQRAVFDFGGRFAIEKDGAGERMFYYWAPKKGEAEVRLAFFMADQSFKIVEAKDG